MATFKNDILPMFFNYKSNMAWRLDLTKYEDVVANADTIYELIKTKQMPPPNYAPLTTDQINAFQQWMKDGYPE